ncbi:MAG: preprotein translocase subunit YajC, partial [Rhodospirillaceae bacterium]|nr:preprotein translocase subunit YajC [Rhodospirillaceae bacterium]
FSGQEYESMVPRKLVSALAKASALGLVLIALAGCPPMQQGGEGGEAGGGDMLMSILPLILIFVVFYFLLIRPQQRKQKAHREMLQNVNRGDDIVTTGGLVGNVVKVGRGDTLLVEIAPDVRVRVMRNMLSQIMPRHEQYADDEDEDEDEEDEREDETLEDEDERDEDDDEEFEDLEEEEEDQEEEDDRRRRRRR